VTGPVDFSRHGESGKKYVVTTDSLLVRKLKLVFVDAERLDRRLKSRAWYSLLPSRWS
jgi:hypothetical protein